MNNIYKYGLVKAVNIIAFIAIILGQIFCYTAKISWGNSLSIGALWAILLFNLVCYLCLNRKQIETKWLLSLLIFVGFFMASSLVAFLYFF